MRQIFLAAGLMATFTVSVFANWRVSSAGDLTSTYSPNRYGETIADRDQDQDQESKDDIQHHDWISVLREHVAEGERLLRWLPPENLDALERSQEQSRVNQCYRNLVADLPGMHIDARLRVVRVIERTPPTPPRPLPGNASDFVRRMYEDRVQRYEQAVEAYKARRYCVVMAAPWQQDAVPPPPALQRQIATAPHASRAGMTRNWRAQVPQHDVYFWTGDQGVTTWRENQIKRIRGQVSRLAVETVTPRIRQHTPAPNYSQYVKIDIVLTDVDHNVSMLDGPNVEEAPDDESEANNDEARIASFLTMARNYEQAQRPDLARREYQRVIDEYPDSAAAAQAQRALARLDDDTP